MGVTICIPTYFANNLLLNCMSSIFQNVKNPKVIVYKNDVGFVKACNELIQKTTDDVILLNDDTFILTDIVEEMAKLAYSKTDIGIVGGKSLSPNETVNNYGIYVAPDGNTQHKFFGKRRDEVTHVESQKAVEGSCIFIKREVINRLGVFDEAYGMGYREEVDYCLRARESGWKIVSSPKAEYIHLVSQTNARLGISNDTHKIFMDKWGSKLALGKI